MKFNEKENFKKNLRYGICSCCELEEEYLDNECKGIYEFLTKGLFWGKDKLLENQEKKLIDNNQNSFSKNFNTKLEW